MVEINYFSKYLKYKQKYLKQKNLQIGGGTIKLRITIKNENSKIGDFTFGMASSIRCIKN